MERVRLDQQALQIQFTEQLPQHSSFMVFAGGVAGLADRHTQSGRIQRHLGNERGSPTGGGLNGAPERLAVTHELIEIRCTAWDLGDHPVTDRSTQGRHIHLVEEVAEGGVRRRTPELDAQRLGEHGVVADGVGAAFSFRSNAPDPASSGSHSGFPVPPPAADTRLETEPRAASAHLESTSDC